MNITKDTKIADILKHTSKSKAVFKKYRMGCASCMGSLNETLETGCLMHGLNFEKVLQELKTPAA